MIILMDCIVNHSCWSTKVSEEAPKRMMSVNEALISCVLISRLARALREHFVNCSTRPWSHYITMDTRTFIKLAPKQFCAKKCT